MTHANDMLTSRNNPRVKAYAALGRAAERRAQKRYWCEGQRCVDAALAAHITSTPTCAVQRIVVETSVADTAAEIIARAEKADIPVTYCTPECYTKMSHLRTGDGVSALIALPHTDTFPAPEARCLVAWCISDPGNMGALIRTAAAFGWTACVAVQPHVDPFHPAAVRASAGAISRIQITSCHEDAARQWLAERGDTTCVLSPRGGEAIPPHGTQFHTCIVGSEAHGVPADMCDTATHITIPMTSYVESLNVTAATAIALYMLHTHNVYNSVSATP